MANTDWPNKSLKIEREKEKAEIADAAYRAGIEAGAKALQIAGATGQGGSPGQLYQRPLQNPDPGEAVFGVEKDGQTFFEFLKAMGIFFPTRVPKNDPNKGKAPYDDKGNELSAPVPGRSDWAGANKDMKIAGGPSFDINETPATRRIRKIRTLQERGVGGEKGNAGDILKKGVQLPNIQASATSRQIRDRLKPFTHGKDYDDVGGSLRGIPDTLRIQLLRDAMAKNQLPANNIRRLQDSGHMTIQDPDDPKRLKIIDLLGPQA